VEQKGIKSIEVGGRLLKVLAMGLGPLPLKDLAARAGLSASAAHHYLVSYRRLGLVRQHKTTLAYEIGPFARELGYKAIDRSAALTAAHEFQRRVRDRLNESVTLAVWGHHGPVIISVEESNKPVAVTMRVGATLPLLGSVSGLTLAAFMPRNIIDPAIRAEYAAGRLPVEGLSRRELNLKLKEIRRSLLVNHSGPLLSGFAAVATPMLTPEGRIVAAMSAFGSSDLLDYSLAGQTAQVLLEAGAAFTEATRHM